MAALDFACRICFNRAEREMPKWQVERKLFGLIADLVKSANGFVLSDLEHEKSELINMTNNCDKSQITQKIVRLTIFRKFSQCLLNRQLALDFSDYYNITKNWEKSSDLRFFATQEKSQFLLLRANRVS